MALARAQPGKLNFGSFGLGSQSHLASELGEDPKREGLQKTPLRVTQALSFFTHGYRTDLAQVINNALFT